MNVNWETISLTQWSLLQISRRFGRGIRRESRTVCITATTVTRSTPTRPPSIGIRNSSAVGRLSSTAPTVPSARRGNSIWIVTSFTNINETPTVHRRAIDRAIRFSWNIIKHLTIERLERRGISFVTNANANLFYGLYLNIFVMMLTYTYIIYSWHIHILYIVTITYATLVKNVYELWCLIITSRHINFLRSFSRHCF